MTWSRHQHAGYADVQTRFDEGGRLMTKDDDAPVANPTDLQDDVPAYLEFLTIKARQNEFPSPFQDAQYNVIETYERLEGLRAACFANIKLVTDNWILVQASPPIYRPLLGYSSPSSEGIVYKASSLDGIVALHEYGHTVGLQHRANSVNAFMYDPYNPTQKETTIDPSSSGSVHSSHSGYPSCRTDLSRCRGRRIGLVLQPLHDDNIGRQGEVGDELHERRFGVQLRNGRLSHGTACRHGQVRHPPEAKMSSS